MGKIFTLTGNIKTVIQDALDDLITELGKNCRIVYPPRWLPCNNCVWDTVTQRATNVWKTGGPMQFPNGTACPVCGGHGQRSEEVSKVIKFLCEWEPKKFFLPIPNLQVRAPFAMVQTKGFMEYLPDVQNSDYMIFQSDLENIQRMKFKLVSEGWDRSNIIQGRYFVATWERVP